jgi:hypothetical protein
MDVPEVTFPNQSMAAYSVFTRDNEPDETARLDPEEPAVLSYRRESPSAAEHPVQQFESGGELDNDPAGQIVLRLPDLASSQPMSLRLLIMPQLFWVAIVLGVLLASVLIWGGPKPVPSEPDVIPAGSGQAPWHPSAPLDDSPEHDQTRREIRAARRMGPIWDSNSPPAMPGVATPVGTIITGASE